ncbi:chondroitinase-AC [Desertivirga xinjiangensis]|uniref:chondroitinase-AC n=1 Tax=Desertivirga xinjiangensis TaxID=539206 RepID=UPI00210E83A7|nr:chondroitinase-AC [Pedobacter xinjiangensis]
MTRSRKIFCLLSLMLALPVLADAQATYPFGTIIKRVFEDVSKNAKNVERPAEKALGSLQKDGTWPDINYGDQSITNWQPAEHIGRTQDLVQAYTSKGSMYYGREDLYGSIIKALSVWFEKDPKSGNWWHNEINMPQRLGITIILMRFATKQLPEELENKLFERMKRGDVEAKTGANKTDIATHFFYRALLTEDKELLEFSLNELFKPVSLVDGEEGLQHDFSYLQHGPQLYISGYGSVFISGVIKIAKYVAGTPYALSKEKLALFSTFYRDTYLKTLRSRYIDFNVEGRGVSRPGILRKPSEKYQLNNMVLIDPEHTAQLENERLRVDSSVTEPYKVQAFHKHFWKGDYTLHIRPEYSFNVRIASARTKRSEMGNKENNYGRYLSDGATNIQVRGPEYYNIMPVWEWDKIPGTTSKDHNEDLKMEVNWGETGRNEFAGGVSDGVYGATAYQLDYDGVKAKKSWFFFDEEVVCLGADINSSASEAVTTSVNQAWLNGNVSTSLGKSFKKESFEELKSGANSWVLHDNVGYYFPQETNLKISTMEQSGNWFKINNSHSANRVSGNVFKLWIDHGSKPASASYSYIVLPAIKNIKSYNPKNLSIISNTAQNQAVYHSESKIFQAVFYVPSSVEINNAVITVNKPCVLMLKEAKGGKFDLFVADPLQKESSVVVSMKDVKTGKLKSVSVELPGGAYKGDTKKVGF